MTRIERTAPESSATAGCHKPKKQAGQRVSLQPDRLTIRRLDVQDPVVLYRARRAPDPEAWILRCIGNGALAEHSLQQATALAETTREIGILLDIMSDWWLQLAGVTRANSGPETRQANAFRLRAREQMAVVTAKLDAIANRR